MTAMLHPTTAIPVGIFVNFLGQYLSKKIFWSQTDGMIIMVLNRFLTYSLTMHLAVIASLAYYLYAIWIPLEITSNFNFENLPFNQCPCDYLAMFNITCTNIETESSFQNIFLGVPIESFLIALLVASISCHLIHSLILVFPSPLSLLSFYLGNFEEEIQTNEESNVINEEGSKSSHKIKFVMGILIFSTLAGIVASPYYLFGAHLEKGTILNRSLANKMIFTLSYFRNNLPNH